MSKLDEQAPGPLLLVHTGLFQDAETVSAAIASLEQDVQTFELDTESMTEEDWDRFVSLVLSSNKIITV